MSRGEGSHDFAFLSELAELEDVIAIVYEEFPEARGLFQTLLGNGTYQRILEESKARAVARDERGG